MAGKRMKLRMDMPIFSTTPVDRKVLTNWQRSIAVDALREALSAELNRMTSRTIWFDYDEPRSIGAFVDVIQDASPGQSYCAHAKLSSLSMDSCTNMHSMRKLLTPRKL
jgi:hypothetical protein